jgi:hypothetical protein
MRETVQRMDTAQERVVQKKGTIVITVGGGEG